jgi:hypothetical protein
MLSPVVVLAGGKPPVCETRLPFPATSTGKTKILNSASPGKALLNPAVRVVGGIRQGNFAIPAVGPALPALRSYATGRTIRLPGNSNVRGTVRGIAIDTPMEHPSLGCAFQKL